MFIITLQSGTNIWFIQAVLTHGPGTFCLQYLYRCALKSYSQTPFSRLLENIWQHLGMAMVLYVSNFGGIFLFPLKCQCDGHALLWFTCHLHQNKLYPIDHINDVVTTGSTSQFPDKRSVIAAVKYICSLTELIPGLFYKHSWENFYESSLGSIFN